jgi:hypothetical protein
MATAEDRRAATQAGSAGNAARAAISQERRVASQAGSAGNAARANIAKVEKKK